VDVEACQMAAVTDQSWCTAVVVEALAGTFLIIDRRVEQDESTCSCRQWRRRVRGESEGTMFLGEGGRRREFVGVIHQSQGVQLLCAWRLE